MDEMVDLRRHTAEMTNPPMFRPISDGWGLAAYVAFALAHAWGVSPASAQDREPACGEGSARIVGVVIDAATDVPLSGAYLSVTGTDRGSLTTDDGRFLLCGMGAGPQLLAAERLGYGTRQLPVVANAESDPVLVRLQPDPILMEGLEIVTNRFERRRRAVTTIVRAYDQESLATSPWSVADFVDSRPGVMAMPCGVGKCVYSRGSMIEPRVYLDEFRLLGGWVELESIPTSQLYMLEVYGHGRHIRAYTHGFMERAAKTRLAPFPIWR